MKNAFTIFLILTITIIFSSCSKTAGKTATKLKLNLSKIVNFSNGIGSGGAILFGKSASGEQFGKYLSSSELSLDLPNGQWSFYAVMWQKTTGNFDGQAFCGKGSSVLNGSAANISLNLNNANCADNDFSGGDGYQVSTVNKFARPWFEECDELSLSSSKTCLKDNQGSALSFRLAFKNYKKSSAGSLVISNEAIYSECSNTASAYSSGLQNIHFPTGNSAMPFVVSLEMFLGSNDCGDTVSETKGVYTQTFSQGLGASSAINKIVKSDLNSCEPNFNGNEDGCLDNHGTYSGGVCTITEAFINTFNSTSCKGTALPLQTKNIKNIVSIPKSFLCRFNDTSLTGKASFPGGAGTTLRPYKICNEWQMNQVGEYNSDTANSDSYKLMNDLDMNKAGISGYPAPLCAGQDQYEQHMNLNPIDKIDCYTVVNTKGYTGVFNGNNKTISNARINSNDKNLNYFGFSRQLGGTVKNLNFMRLEVRAGDYVGGVTGSLSGTNATIKNVTIKKSDISGKDTIGSVAGYTGATTSIYNTKVYAGEVYGNNSLGGISGINTGSIEKAMYQGSVINDVHSTSTNAGGLVGTNSGTIKNSFSEGMVATTSTSIGGIAGINSGDVKIVYSTMSLIPTNEGGTVVAGGILGTHNSGGVLNDCFSDAVINQLGNNTLTKNGIIGNTNGGTYSANSCFTNNSQTYSPFVGIGYNNLRDGTFPGSVTFSEGNGNWIFADNSTPRLAWESDRKCLNPLINQSVGNQIAQNKGGSQDNPIIICTYGQLTEITGRNSPSYFYKLADDINMSQFVFGDIFQFYGELDGDDHELYGLNLSSNNSSPDSGFGIVTENHGTIKNLNVVGNQLINTDIFDSNIGLLVAQNFGTLDNIEAFGNKIRGESRVGGLVGTNESTGIIKDSNVEVNSILGASEMGGVAGRNDHGTILRVTADNDIKVYASGVSFSAIGGITGGNIEGIINQTSVRGSITMADLATLPLAGIGGITGDNQGSILNSYVRPDFKLSVFDGKGVGGIAGIMSLSTSTIQNSFMLGRIIPLGSSGDALATLDTISATDERTIGPLVGASIPGATITNSYYLPNVYMYDVTPQTISGCVSAGVATLSVAPTTSGGFRISNNNSLGYFSFTRDSATQISFNATEYTCQIGDNLEFGLALNNYAEYGVMKTQAGFMNISDFSGYDIADGNGPEVINYFVSMMNGLPMPAGTPIWSIDSGDAKHPKLLQIEH